MIDLIAGLGLSLAAGQFPPPPPPPPPQTVTRDVARDVPPRTGTAIVRGRVTDRDTGQPIARATVVLMSRAIPRSPGERQPQTRTALDGSYELRDLPGGTYSVSVIPNESRPTHLPQYYGEDGPADVSRRRRPAVFTLADGEVRENVNVALSRALAIEGRVVDDLGEPMAGVHMLLRVADTGQNAPMTGPFQFSTDDRGMFRIFGVRPGRYLVCANPRRYSVFSQTEVRERPIETCHPSASSDDQAQPITVAHADVGGVEIRIQRSRAFTVSGVAVDSSGAPLQGNQVSLVRLERNGSGSSSIEVTPGGHFIARGLIPGEYAISARTVMPRGPDDPGEGEFALVAFRIDNADVENLVVVTRPAAKVAGRLVFDGTSAPPAAESMRVMTTADNSSRWMTMGPPPSARVAEDLSFELSGLSQPVALTVTGAPSDWIVKSVRYRAEDVTDRLVDFSGAREGEHVEIALTNRAARVSGRVLDEQGRPTQDALVVLLPADPSVWNVRGPMRGISSPKPDGSFRTIPLRAGEYVILALAPEDWSADMSRMGLQRDTKWLERLAAIGQRIILGENEEPVLELRVSKLQ